MSLISVSGRLACLFLPLQREPLLMKTAPNVLPPVLTSRRLHWRRNWVALLLGCGVALHGLPALAARAAEEVTQLLEQGKAELAAKQADSHLQQNPGDVEMRFLRGVIATEQKQNAQAIKIFSALTREYPHMPEPYNNLAVLYAADGQERKAAEALEQAIRTNPSYSTAHENLGDLYARMASEAYSKALQLDGSRQDIRPKLALITQIVPGASNQGKTVVAYAGSVVAPAAAKAPAKAEVAAERKPEPKPEAKPEAPQPPKAQPAAKPEPVAVAKAEPVPAAKPATPAPTSVSAPVSIPVATSVAPAPVVATPAAATAQPVASAKAKDEPAAKPAAMAEAKPAARQSAVADVERAVHAWASAWEKKDMTAYLDAYSDKFQPTGGGNLAAWKEERRARIVGKQAIDVKVQNLQVGIDGDQATAKFRQYYAAGSLKTVTRKTLSLRHEKGQWHIVREATGG